MEEVVLYTGETQTTLCCQDVKKYQHRKTDCELRMKNVQEEGVLMASNQSNKFTKDTWVGDTGATSHMTNSDKGLIDVQMINEQIRVGNGKFMIATKKGRLPAQSSSRMEMTRNAFWK